MAVTLAGEVVLDADAGPLHLASGQYLKKELVNILGPFEGLEGTKGPDLMWPRPTLRIVPRKISGAPHILGTRLPTQSIFALAARGLSLEQIARIYPHVESASLRDSIDLEQQLTDNSRVKRAA